jgi:hypothetical protein
VPVEFVDVSMTVLLAVTASGAPHVFLVLMLRKLTEVDAAVSENNVFSRFLSLSLFYRFFVQFYTNSGCWSS